MLFYLIFSHPSQKRGKAVVNDKIDGVFLNPTRSSDILLTYISKAVKYEIRGVCVLPARVMDAKVMLEKQMIAQNKHHKPKLIACVDFPWGNGIPRMNIDMSMWVYDHGAEEIDYMINIGWLKDKRLTEMASELETLKQITDWNEGKLKFIIEKSLLSEKMLKQAIMIAEEAGVDYIKTSSGVINVRPTAIVDIHDIKKLTRIPIKAAGGIKSKLKAKAFLEAGASIIGASDFESILKE